MKTEDKLKDFISENIDSFEGDDPSVELWDKIDAEIVRPKPNYRWLWQTAAAIGIAVTSILVYELFDEETTETIIVNQPQQLAETNAAIQEFPPMAPEVQEAKDIYEAKIEHKMHELSSYKLEFPGVEEEVTAEFEVMDEMYDELESQLSHGSENEKVISALIESYQLKLEILEDILENLETEKNENDENINP